MPESTAKLADLPLNVTRVVPLEIRAADRNGRVRPTRRRGEAETVGAAVDVVTVKLVELVPVPFVVVTETGPLDAPLGTDVVDRRVRLNVNVADDAVEPHGRRACEAGAA